MCTANVFAAANADVTYNDTRVSTTSYAVSVHTNGKATDGVVEISYDANALSCVESDLEISEDIDMYSVNVEDGVIKISYLSEEAIPAGTLFTVFFDVANEYVNKVVSATIACVANDASGAALTTGELVIQQNQQVQEARQEQVPNLRQAKTQKQQLKQ